jgi:integrase
MATIRKLPSGRWNAQVRRKGEKPISQSFPSKALAEQWARSIEGPMDKGQFIDRSEAESTTIGELIDRYLSEVTDSKKGARQERYRLRFLKERLGHFIVASFQSKHLASYRDSRLKEGISGTTVVHEINCLSHVLEVSIKDWGIPLGNNPAKLLRRPPRAKGRTRRLAPAELEALLRALQGSPAVQSLVLLAVETGMRRGELMSMTWENVRIKDRVIFLPDTKNGEPRAVPLSSKAMEILKGIPRNIGGTVFSMAHDSVSQAFKRACRRAGIQDLRFHDLRHEATSRFFEKGLSMMEVSSITGHKTLSMLKRYTCRRSAKIEQRFTLNFDQG